MRDYLSSPASSPYTSSIERYPDLVVSIHMIIENVDFAI